MIKYIDSHDLDAIVEEFLKKNNSCIIDEEYKFDFVYYNYFASLANKEIVLYQPGIKSGLFSFLYDYCCSNGSLSLYFTPHIDKVMFSHPDNIIPIKCPSVPVKFSDGACVFIDLYQWQVSALKEIAEVIAANQSTRIHLFLYNVVLPTIEDYLEKDTVEYKFLPTVFRLFYAEISSVDAGKRLSLLCEKLRHWSLAKGTPRGTSDEHECHSAFLKIQEEAMEDSFFKDDFHFKSSFLQQFCDLPDVVQQVYLYEYLKGLKGCSSNKTMKFINQLKGIVPKSRSYTDCYDSLYLALGRFYNDFFFKAPCHIDIAAFPLSAQDRFLTASSMIELAMTRLCREKADASPLSWVDLGCGHGEIMQLVRLERMKINSFKFIGVDSSKGSIAYANQNKENYMEFECKNVFSAITLWENDGVKFDVVSAFEFIEHLDDPLEFLLLVHKITKSYLVLGTPLEENVPFFISNEHLWSFTREGIESLLQISGFKVLICKESWVGRYSTDHNWLTVVAQPV